MLGRVWQLPVLAVPLLPGDPDVPLNLQGVLDRCYETGPYRRQVRYGDLTLDPPLPPRMAAWAAERLKAVVR